ncbi:hypothetical protein EJ063_07605 [Vibrio aquaticus]|uniref:Uncharacterized protein n=1 Tax=Vibrio aquaticus TaxID=2496559 RepID=A0A432CXM2_9VIBR|nr:hypothetical protein [Vibrio aquaticus]RTZ16650.1 hypothetical protein EJ063_07605 [Vibrio aquaticus]
MKNIVNFEPRLNIGREVFSNINVMAGRSLDNGILKIDFGRIRYTSDILNKSTTEELFEFQIIRDGINISVYVDGSIVWNMFSIDAKLFDVDYISYLTQRYFGWYGIKLIRKVEHHDFNLLSLVLATLISADDIQIPCYVNVNEVEIDTHLLTLRRQPNLPPNLMLYANITQFQTTLNVDEVRDLDSGDVVFVKRKANDGR